MALVLVMTGLSLFLTTCATIPSHDNPDTGRGTNGQIDRVRTTQEPLFTGNGGRGLVIAVPAPSISGGSQADNWIPQLFQDLITSDLARYSAMTVLDRSNEALALAEQQLSMSGYYSDDDFIALGRLTNARYIVAGNIINISGLYTVSFRINNSETNEIQASFSKQYSLGEIGNGLAAKEAVMELLEGMGITLTAHGERQLLAIQERPIRAQVRLAQGMTAERNNNLVEALVFFQQALGADPGLYEASQRSQNLFHDSPGTSIRERANWAVVQKEKWEKIFNDLGVYIDQNLLIVVYDFSFISDRFNAGTNRVDFTVTPGIKLIPDSEVLTVWKTVVDEWERIRILEENTSWVNSLSLGNLGAGRGDNRRRIGLSVNENSGYQPVIGLFDSDGIRIAQNRMSGLNRFSQNVTPRYNRNLQILPQNRYFNDASFLEVSFRGVNINDITDDLSIRVESINVLISYQFPARIMSINEWEEWLRNR